MTSLILAALLSQTAPTQAQIVGALNTISTAWLDRANRTKAFNADKTRVCVGPASGKTLTGRTTIRFGVLTLSPQVQTMFTMPLEDGQTEYREQYAAAEVQIDPALATDQLLVPLETWNTLFDVIREEVEVRASPLLAYEACFIRRDAPEIQSAALYRCACAVSSACKLADGTTAAPLGVTLSPGAFTSSAACQRKSCVTRFDGPGIDKTWPAACPK